MNLKFVRAGKLPRADVTVKGFFTCVGTLVYQQLVLLYKLFWTVATGEELLSSARSPVQLQLVTARKLLTAELTMVGLLASMDSLMDLQLVSLYKLLLTV